MSTKLRDCGAKQKYLPDVALPLLVTLTVENEWMKMDRETKSERKKKVQRKKLTKVVCIKTLWGD
jgi:hypothetical protein